MSLRNLFGRVAIKLSSLSARNDETEMYNMSGMTNRVDRNFLLTLHKRTLVLLFTLNSNMLLFC